MDKEQLKILTETERWFLWLACWTIHRANYVRPKTDGLKVGGHQASSASMVSLMTALYFAVLRPEDRVAVKPHRRDAGDQRVMGLAMGYEDLHSRYCCHKPPYCLAHRQHIRSQLRSDGRNLPLLGGRRKLFR